MKTAFYGWPMVARGNGIGGVHAGDQAAFAGAFPAISAFTVISHV